MGSETDFALGYVCTMQYTDDVLLSCTFETCMVLLTYVIQINSGKKDCYEKKKSDLRQEFNNLTKL